MKQRAQAAGYALVSSPRSVQDRRADGIMKEHGSFIGVTALQDIYLLSEYADAFVGTEVSSFSHLIANLLSANDKHVDEPPPILFCSEASECHSNRGTFYVGPAVPVAASELSKECTSSAT